MEREPLTNCETLVMKCVWSSEEDISMQELKKRLNERFKKDYKRTTICTFLLHMEEKGYLRTYRNGLYSYVHPIVTEEEFSKEQAGEVLDFWFDKSPSKLLASVYDDKKLDAEEIRKIQDIIDKMK